MAFIGSFAVWDGVFPGYLDPAAAQERRQRAVPGLNLSQQRGDREGRELTVSAMFDTGFYQRIAQDLRQASCSITWPTLPPPRAGPSLARAPGACGSPPPAWRRSPMAGGRWAGRGGEPLGFCNTAQPGKGSLKTAGWLAVLGGLSCLVATFGVNGSAGRWRRHC